MENEEGRGSFWDPILSKGVAASGVFLGLFYVVGTLSSNLLLLFIGAPHVVHEPIQEIMLEGGVVVALSAGFFALFITLTAWIEPIWRILDKRSKKRQEKIAKIIETSTPQEIQTMHDYYIFKDGLNAFNGMMFSVLLTSLLFNGIRYHTIGLDDCRKCVLVVSKMGEARGTIVASDGSRILLGVGRGEFLIITLEDTVRIQSPTRPAKGTQPVLTKGQSSHAP